MLHEFLTVHRAGLIDRCRLKVVQRRAPKATDAELEHGVPLFLDQLIQDAAGREDADPAICRRSVEANGGVLSVRDRPGSGCVFTIELPRHALREEAPAA